MSLGSFFVDSFLMLKLLMSIPGLGKLGERIYQALAIAQILLQRQAEAIQG
jgi:hypothetical protein